MLIPSILSPGVGDAGGDIPAQHPLMDLLPVMVSSSFPSLQVLPDTQCALS